MARFGIKLLACKTVVLFRLNSTFASLRGIFLTAEGTIRRHAPEDRAKNTSTTEGSKVNGEDSNTTSSAVILKTDLLIKYLKKKIYLFIFMNSILQFQQNIFAIVVR